jgi:hypothetical protein
MTLIDVADIDAAAIRHTRSLLMNELIDFMINYEEIARQE